MKTFAFIFARGGSKGLPNKNVKLLGGIPLVAHAINLAKEIENVEEVFVSTEANNIKGIANDFGAEVIDRPAELAGDTTPEWLVWQHAIAHLEMTDRKFDYFLSLPPTAPLRFKEDILKCFKLISEDADVVITVSPANRNPYFNMVFREHDGTSSLVLKKNSISRRQEAPKVYDMTTAAYLSTPSFIKNNDGIFEGHVKSVIIPKERAIDIDDEIDYLLTKVIYENQI